VPLDARLIDSYAGRQQERQQRMKNASRSEYVAAETSPPVKNEMWARAVDNPRAVNPLEGLGREPYNHSAVHVNCQNEQSAGDGPRICARGVRVGGQMPPVNCDGEMVEPYRGCGAAGADSTKQASRGHHFREVPVSPNADQPQHKTERTAEYRRPGVGNLEFAGQNHDRGTCYGCGSVNI
jgi:hypothetical protein